MVVLRVPVTCRLLFWELLHSLRWLLGSGALEFGVLMV